MAIKIRCPGCGVRISAPDLCRNKKITCPKCSLRLVAEIEKDLQEGENVPLEEIPTALVQTKPVLDLFLRSSRDFYDFYEDIEEKLSGQHRALDLSTLFESMTFFFFLLDFELFHSKQLKRVQEFLLNECDLLITDAFSSMGSRNTLLHVIDQRLSQYAEFVRSSDSRDPIEFFPGSRWHNPLVNNLLYFHGRNEITVRDAPLVIDDFFVDFLRKIHWSGIPLQIVLSFRLALRRLFEDNTDFRVLHETEIQKRIQKGLEDGKNFIKRLKNEA